MAIFSLIRIAFIFCKHRLDELLDPLENKILLFILFLFPRIFFRKKKQIEQTPTVDKKVYTKKIGSGSGRDIRSIQIGLRKEAVAMLLDPTVVIKIEDVTEKFHACGHALAAGDEAAAMSLLEIDEQTLHSVPLDIQSNLCMI